MDRSKSIARAALGKGFPQIVCLCGSTRFIDAFRAAEWTERLKGKIVLSIGVSKLTDAHGAHSAEERGPDVVQLISELHFHQIDLADEVFILNVGGYIGESTANQLAYALAGGRPVRTLEPLNLKAWLVERSRQMNERAKPHSRKEGERVGLDPVSGLGFYTTRCWTDSQLINHRPPFDTKPGEVAYWAKAPGHDSWVLYVKEDHVAGFEREAAAEGVEIRRLE